MLNKTKMICAQYWGCQSSLNNLNNLLFAFQIFFGLFLTFTVTWNRNLHTAFVALFALAAIWHFVLIAFFDRAPFFEMAVLTMAIGGFLALIVMVAAITFAPGLDIPPFLFWAIECIALTGMVLFTPVRTCLCRPHSTCPGEFRTRASPSSASSSTSFPRIDRIASTRLSCGIYSKATASTWTQGPPRRR
mmetsp:Transcript_12568/g.31841  ORF Transcript_12568/g.31841 Transcript_12568/m.31841 type:complete len:190 (+) Transcript_12568:261-830(+)